MRVMKFELCPAWVAGFGFRNEVGNAVGCDVGNTVGTTGLGNSVGSGLGDRVGNAVGNGLVGSTVGNGLGNGVGNTVGRGLGFNVGTLVGATLGPEVGPGLGSGEIVGAGVGMIVGSNRQFDAERSQGPLILSQTEEQKKRFVPLSISAHVEGPASHHVAGSTPVKLFESTRRTFRLVIALNSTGMVPVSEFE